MKKLHEKLLAIALLVVPICAILIGIASVLIWLGFDFGTTLLTYNIYSLVTDGVLVVFLLLINSYGGMKR